MPPNHHHYVAEVTFKTADGRFDALAQISALVYRAGAVDSASVDEIVKIEGVGASVVIDLLGTAPLHRPARLRQLSDSIVAQARRRTFPDSITLRWEKAK